MATRKLPRENAPRQITTRMFPSRPSRGACVEGRVRACVLLLGCCLHARKRSSSNTQILHIACKPQHPQKDKIIGCPETLADRKNTTFRTKGHYTQTSRRSPAIQKNITRNTNWEMPKHTQQTKKQCLAEAW